MTEGQISLFPGEAEYDAFVEKFTPKKTTDDCYTPEAVYDAVADWVAAEYGLDRSSFVRPFWPGRDYQAFDYPEGCVVVDNPPFSIRKQIQDWYQARGIRFFLFAPALTLLSGAHPEGICHLAVGAPITYQNGADVPTSFATNLEPETALRTAPELYRAVDRACALIRAELRKSLPKYAYPDHVVTAALAQRYGKYGVTYRVPWREARIISALDSQREMGKTVFGGGLLLSDRAAAEKAAAEKAAAEKAAAEKAAATVWKLSRREREIVEVLNLSTQEEQG